MHSKISIKEHDGVGSGDWDDWGHRLSCWIPDQACAGSLSSRGLGLALRWAGLHCSTGWLVDGGPSILGLTVCLRVFLSSTSSQMKRRPPGSFDGSQYIGEKLCHVAIPTCPRSWGCGLSTYRREGMNLVDSPAWHTMAPPLQAVAEMAEGMWVGTLNFTVNCPTVNARPRAHCHSLIANSPVLFSDLKGIRILLSLQPVGRIWSLSQSLPTLVISAPLVTSFFYKPVYDESPL